MYKTFFLIGLLTLFSSVYADTPTSPTKDNSQEIQQLQQKVEQDIQQLKADKDKFQQDLMQLRDDRLKLMKMQQGAGQPIVKPAE